MKNISSHPIFWFGTGLLFILFTHLFVSQFDKTEEKLNQAYELYLAGEKATTIDKRNEAFNQSLSIYKDLEKSFDPSSSNGKLYYNIANNYFQLNQYPEAILYYMKAEKLMPDDEKLQKNLDIALKKASVDRFPQSSSFNPFLLITNYFSLARILQFLFFTSLILFILGLFFIFFPTKGLKIMIGILSLNFLILLSSIFYSQFISPSYAVILKANQLYKDAGFQYAKVLDIPIKPGTEVKVLDILQAGRWLKILNQDGTVGYIPYDSIEII